MEAARAGKLEIVRLLIEHGADKAIRNKEGSTAIELAKAKDYNDIVDFLR
ncbi:hypothetical protein FRY98_03100 [Paenibacillus faecis]|uniref:Uncharacterized protein n=2 Tax=Paenibacillus faecis TaxID=862114 RepID=A0A5D0D1X0_9BACL|nr:hypothetical protein FRY98_03100 [Paenibacillus faecis]